MRGTARRVYREDSEQRALIQWADMTRLPLGYALHRGAMVGDYLFAIPNGGARSAIEGSRLVGLGVRAGVFDLFFSFPSAARKKHGLYVEMKAPKPHSSKVTDKQTAFAKRMQAVGFECVVCYGWDAARNALRLYLQHDL